MSRYNGRLPRNVTFHCDRGSMKLSFVLYFRCSIINNITYCFPAGLTMEVSYVDVYDIASEIGKDFEKLIDSYGPESITNLMPKVINVLEQLECMVCKQENHNATIQDLNAKIRHLETSQLEKAEHRAKFVEVRMLLVSQNLVLDFRLIKYKQTIPDTTENIGAH